MFGKLSSFVDKAEKATGLDLDGDGKKGGKKTSKKSTKSRAAAPAVNPIDVLEKATGRDIDGDGDIAGEKIKKSGTRAAADLDDGASVPDSTCTGNKKSLFIGCNYPGSKAELRGCINDVHNLHEWLTKTWNFPTDSEHMRILTDDQSAHPEKMPTRANMIAAMKWLVAGAKKNDSLFMHYSGHGGSQKDTSPDTDEVDGKDETLCPTDYATAGVIVDDELHEMLVANLPEGVRLTVLFDCCHSGSMLDLPYQYTIDGKLEVHETDNRQEAINAAIAAGSAYFLTKDLKAAKAHGMAAIKHLMAGPGAGDAEAQKRAIAIRTTMADVITLSGCRDEQTSADAHIGKEMCGAMSWAFKKAFTEHPKMTYTEMLKEVRENLHGKYSQVPMLSAGKKLKLDAAPFKM